MSNVATRLLRKVRGLSPVPVSGDIVAPENMFWVEDPSEFRVLADVMMTDAALPMASRLNRDVLMGQDTTALEHLDDYLYAVHREFADRTDDESLRLLRNLIGYGGAYVGEVLRLSALDAIWLTPAMQEQDHPNIMALGPVNGQSTGVVYDARSDHYAFPYAKIFKFLMNGREDSTAFFVQVMAREMDPT